MNAVEIEAAVAELADQPFDANEFAFAFLEAFGNKATTIKRLRAGNTNKSDLNGGVLQTNNIHIAVCDTGRVGDTLKALHESPQTTKAKAKFLLATDGETLEAEDLASGEAIATRFADLADHFGFFLPLAGISTVREIKDNPVDVRATGRLNKLYIELLKHNPDWAERRHDMNHFMARLIFCFFAEDTDIFDGQDLFTRTVDTMSERDGSNLADVMSTLFRAMDIRHEDRDDAELPGWAKPFPYVNGALFSGATDVPHFTKLARSYLIQAGNLKWKAINPDIFGSMIQAVADDDERGQLGMHYTSVPNILKVLNPLFLDNLREQLEDAGDNARKLLNLRKRMARIRVFDPACGSGNFLVIAYKEMRAIEAEVNRRRKETHLKSAIPLTNFRGIELRDFAAEIARLALVIAEYQCDVTYRGQKEALKDVLPLSRENWITQGNALRLDWLTVCPPTGTGAKVSADDLFETPLDQAEIDFQNEGGETYICGNPPYLGSSLQNKEQKADLKAIFSESTKNWKSLDYIAAWFMKAANYGLQSHASSALVATNSICQGQQVAILWPLIFGTGHEIAFAYSSFKWANLASQNAGVTVIIVGLSNKPAQPRVLYATGTDEQLNAAEARNINAYLIAAPNIIVRKRSSPMSDITAMDRGSGPVDGGNLILSAWERQALLADRQVVSSVVRRYMGSSDSIDGIHRYCLWIDQDNLESASNSPKINERIEKVEQFRLGSTKTATVKFAKWPYKFQEIRQTGTEVPIVVPRHSSSNREYLPFAVGSVGDIVADSAFAFYDVPLWNIAILASVLHLTWIAVVCGKIKTDYRYSNTLGWNTFPIPTLTEQNKADLTRCAEDILLAREAHFPASIAEMYDAKRMDKDFPDLRHAHERNDDTLERIYIGRRFKNDTERLEKLFEMYAQMTASENGRSYSSKRKRPTRS
ncbi:putative DNA methylase [Salinisphaera sp. S4-8]|uniref:class I SAM-dependent DNA methyltransferase n=1 Tax=Salinisphaera sp. S4-8 TaxID=633357 RepID=UPI0033421315